MRSVRVLKCSQQTKFCIRTMTKPRRSRGSAGKCRAGTKGTQHGSPGRLCRGKNQTFLACRSARSAGFVANEHNLLFFFTRAKKRPHLKKELVRFRGDGANGRKILCREKKNYLEPIRRHLCLLLHYTFFPALTFQHDP